MPLGTRLVLAVAVLAIMGAWLAYSAGIWELAGLLLAVALLIFGALWRWG